MADLKNPDGVHAPFGGYHHTAAIPANAPDANANQLIDATTSVTDVRVERA